MTNYAEHEAEAMAADYGARRAKMFLEVEIRGMSERLHMLHGEERRITVDQMEHYRAVAAAIDMLEY